VFAAIRINRRKDSRRGDGDARSAGTAQLNSPVSRSRWLTRRKRGDAGGPAPVDEWSTATGFLRRESGTMVDADPSEETLDDWISRQGP